MFKKIIALLLLSLGIVLILGGDTTICGVPVIVFAARLMNQAGINLE